MLGSLVVSGIIDWIKDRSAIKKAKVEGQIKVIQSASNNTADWEQLHAKGSQTSWKDEFWTVVFAVPVIMGFIPGGQIKVIQSASNNTADWEQLHAKGSQTSWKDEFWTVVFAVPLIMGFIPGGEKYTSAGFEALRTMPEWYQYTLVTMVLASFGIRVTSTFKKLMGK